ncbi:hypothetical protein N7451_012180 [Penicillium sp. IBT 35674x]|nr:hypothetical protein N7451_012180 [Penicillium sp. IBT 35674x]
MASDAEESNLTIVSNENPTIAHIDSDAYELEPPTGLSGIADPQIEQQSPLQTPKTPSSFQAHDAEGSWTWEIAGALVSVVCITLLIGFLVYVNGRTYSSWQYSISPNAVVSILAAFAKAATLRPIHVSRSVQVEADMDIGPRTETCSAFLL